MIRERCGSDTCLRDYQEAIRKFAYGPAVTLSVPPLPQSEMEGFSAFLRSLQAKPGTRTEICVSDIGALVIATRIARERGTFLPTIGRWLARQDTDPQLAAFCDRDLQPLRLVQTSEGAARLEYRPPPPELIEHWHTPSIFGASTLRALRDLLGELPVIVELDALDGLPDAPDIEVVLHHADRLISMIACAPPASCEHCSSQRRLLGIDRFGHRIYQYRNAIVS
ncbi:MAG: hypothetical protein FWC54_01205 [Actinomycetia bacterium]|nr:hypothetical protein [Actinomycetes bacterium]